MPKNPSKKLTLIARRARRNAVREVLIRFQGDRSKAAAHFGITAQAVGMILARK